MPELQMSKLCPVLIIKGIASGSTVGIDLFGSWWEYADGVISGHVRTLLPMDYRGTALVRVTNRDYLPWTDEIEIIGGRQKLNIEQVTHKKVFNEQQTVIFDNIPEDAAIRIYKKKRTTLGVLVIGATLYSDNHSSRGKIEIDVNDGDKIECQISKNGVTKEIHYTIYYQPETYVGLCYSDVETKAFFGI